MSKLSEGLESSLGPNVDNLIVEAEDILEMLKSRNFEESQNATVDEYAACEDCEFKHFSTTIRNSNN